MDKTQDIQLMTLKEIVDHLSERYDSVLVVSSRKLTKNEGETYVDYRGGKINCIGLASYAHERLLRSSDSTAEEM